MAVLPANLSRAPLLLQSQLSLSNLNRTNLSLLDVQTQLSTGKQVNRPSDDPVRASAISVLTERLRAGEQRGRNLQAASSSLSQLDTLLGNAGDLVKSAQTIASSNIGLTSDQATRAQQASVVDTLLQSLQNIANDNKSGLYVFGGSTPTTQPVTQVANGFRYAAKGSGLITDIGFGDTIPVTVGGANAIGETSARQKSLIDLNPGLAPTTRISDLLGVNGTGVTLGVVNFQPSSGPAGSIDLTGAATVQDVVTRLTAGIRQYEAANGVTVLGAGGITLSGSRLNFNIPGAQNLTFTDVTAGTTASDLGLSTLVYTAATPTGGDVNPKLTLQTPLNATGLTVPLGTIRVKQTRGGSVTQRDVDLSTATTVDDVRRLIEATNLGVRVEVNAAGTGIDVLNEVAGPVLSIEEVPGNSFTASQLGIRTLDTNTAIADFNAGRGVRIVDGSTNPVTGLPNPSADTDFRITLGNGQAFDVDLKPTDLTTTQGVINAINNAFTAALAQPPINGAAPALAAGQFTAGLSTGPNGIALHQTLSSGPITVSVLNNSLAADDLGLLKGTYDPVTRNLQGEDRATIRVNNLFTDLLDLRDALLRNDSPGITLAGEQLAVSSDRLLTANALVGSYGKRVDDAKNQLDDTKVLDTKLQSELQDVDFAEAATRFSQLQTQLQASLQTAARASSTTLLDFLR